MTTSNSRHASPATTLVSSTEQKLHRYQHIKPITQMPMADSCNPRNGFSDDLSALFDFDSPLTLDPKRPRISKEPSFDFSSDWIIQPPSPPDSAVYPSDGWRHVDQFEQVPHNILTQIDPSRSRTQYGQTTPPDDEQVNSLDSEIMMQEDDGCSEQQPPSGKNAKRNRKSNVRSKKGPMDPHNPEDIRRSKFLERNRVAASKCRQKKKEWTNNLETRARNLQKDNKSLRHMVDSCKEEILFLKGEMLRHGACGVGELQGYFESSAHSFHGMPGENLKQESPSLNSFTHSGAPTRIGSPSDHAHPRPMGYQRPTSRAFSEELERSRHSSVSDQNLELLLTNQFIQDTSDDSIAQRLGR